MVAWCALLCVVVVWCAVMRAGKLCAGLRCKVRPPRAHSLRGAPQELRRTIRLRQNSRSAQRRRDRDRAVIEDVIRRSSENERRIKSLIDQVDVLSAELFPGEEGKDTRNRGRQAGASSEKN